MTKNYTFRPCVVLIISVCVGDSVAAEVRRSLIRNMWNERIKGTKRNVEVWQALLVVRSLVFPPTDEDSETWLKFASLCRKSSRISQAKSTLIKLLQVSWYLILFIYLI